MTFRAFTRALFVSLASALIVAGCVGELGRGDPATTATDPAGRLPNAPGGAAPGPTTTAGPAVDPLPAPSPANAGSAPAAVPPAAPGDPVRGILGCPTVDPPAYGTAAAAILSKPFQASCATCHGGVGEGRDKYPPLPGQLSEAEFIAKVRSGVRDMPAFPAGFVSDAELKADFAALRQAALQPGGLRAAAEHPANWSVAKVEEIYRKGLEVFRKPGALDKQACTNCHSSDGIELAVIGFSDDSILRRAQQHVSPEDALVLRDFVHAQRRRFNIARPCSTDWRPFQPGGSVLPGANAREQDGAFLAELRKRKLTVAAGKVVSLDDAKRAFAEMQAIDLRGLPIGIPLPRWSEDKFNGPGHRDINDYMPAIPTIANRPAEYFALEDQYLANPSDAGLYQLIAENRKNMNDGGYRAANTVPRPPNNNCPVHADSTSWISNEITKPKRESVLIAAHLFREELRRPGSFARRPASPFPDAPSAINAPFHLGAFNIEPPCYDDLAYPSWIKSFPASFRDEFPESDLAKQVVANASDRVTHVWMMLGQVLDESLISTMGMPSNAIHYWAFRNFAQKDVHLPFMYVHRIATQTAYWKDRRGTPLYPKARGPFDEASRDWLHPLLATENQESAGLRAAVAPDAKGLPAVEANQLKGNLIRMMMLIRRELLMSGASLQEDQNYDHCLGVTCQTDEIKGFTSSLKTYRTALSAQGFDAALYVDDTERLVSEVRALMGKAPRRP